MKKIIDNRTGMSLVEVMITTAVASIIMVAIGNSLLSLYQHQSTVSKKDMGNEFTAAFSRVIAQNDSCSQYLNGIPLPQPVAPVEFVIPDYVTSKNDEVVATGDDTLNDLAAGNEIYDGLRCLSLTISNSNLPDQVQNMDLNPADAVPAKDYIRRIAEITLRLAVINPNGDQELKPRRFQVPVVVDPDNNQIQQCASELEVHDACSTIGSTYDPASGACIPASNCFMRGTYTVSTCAPNSGNCDPSIVNPITGAYTCPGASVASQTGQYVHTFTEPCGKKCTRTVTNTVRYYVCLECN